MKQNRIRRGEIYYAKLDPVIGSEQGSDRPVLVVQNNAGNHHSPTVIVTPLTGSPRKNPLPTHVSIPRSCGLERDSVALVEQIRTIDRSRLSEYIGRIGRDLLPALDKALAVCVGLDKKWLSKGEMLVLTLCGRCESDFRQSGYLLVKKGWQEVKEGCDFCQVGRGLAFGVFPLDGEVVLC